MIDEVRYREAEGRLWASLGLSPPERFIHLRSIGSRLRIQETGAGPPVLFLHGGSNAGSSWAPLAARLDGFRCLLIDRPGCGLSEPLPFRLADVASLGEFAEALVADVLDGLSLDRAPIVATSFGGYIALRAAAAHPERVSSVVELGWPVGAPVGRTPLVMRMASAPLLGRLMTAIPPNRRAVKAMLRSIGLRRALAEGKVSEEAVTWFLSLLRDTPTLRNELETNPPVLSLWGGLNQTLVLPERVLSRIQVPAYFFWGEDDVFGGAGVARDFASRLPNAKLELVQGGHAVWMDDPDGIASRVSSVLAEPGGRVSRSF